ncbi:hypothetical protein [Ferirhizobium litorale]|uniref:Entry exclusion lipoprotein TrbK n=1 Tax=Ferirhizobium litorale TaxID=2927786 RepID=A0AAE3QHX7_9HYPH|nr:hypothetical protein [Fererhizobium litorale]MDI7923418.1 hypothetical protein [Fererhizobium litorale]
MKFRKWAALTLMLLCLSGCAMHGSYCDVARPVRPSVSDSLSDETKRQILAENTKIEKLCGVKP